MCLFYDFSSVKVVAEGRMRGEFPPRNTHVEPELSCVFRPFVLWSGSDVGDLGDSSGTAHRSVIEARYCGQGGQS